jgi:hypothetical protein
MNWQLAETIADAVLYEGYMLYPYRPSALKNRQRWSFGTLCPPASETVRSGSDRSAMHCECLLRGDVAPRLDVRLRFLQVQSKAANEQSQPTEKWEEGQPRVVDCEFVDLSEVPQGVTFEFALGQESGSVSAALRGAVQCSAESVVPGLRKVSIDVSNETELPRSGEDGDPVLRRALLSAHCVLAASNAEFVSLLDPPEELKTAAESCHSVGAFPVLVGDSEKRDMMLCSPIVLYDYPQIAPESAGDFFDGTEIDEMLTLRVLTLTDEEKREMARADDRVRSLLERTEITARQQLARNHGIMRRGRS